MTFFPQATFYGIDLMGKTLDAFQLAENVTSNNIANINTPGASQQVVQFGQAAAISSPSYAAHSSGTVGDGVVVQQIQRIHSDAYDALFRGATSSQNYYNTEQTALTSVQSSLGDPNSGVSAQFTAFQTAINELVSQTNGSSTSASVNGVLTQAQALATSLNTSASAIQQQKTSLASQAGTLVSTVNGLLDQIAAINGQIRASTAVGDSPNTLEDQRDQCIDRLSQYMSTQTFIQPDGSALVSVNGQALVNDGVAYHLAAPAITTGSNGSSTLTIGFDNGSTSSVPLGSGQLAALANLYNGQLTSYGTQLDQFAQSLAYETNRITESGYDVNGQPGAALFIPVNASRPISAANIRVGITNASQFPAALASTAAGSLVTSLNSANNVVDTAAQLDGNASLANAPAAAIAGTLTVTVNGVAQSFSYDTAAGGNAASIDAFITNFNAAKLGVTASYDTVGQRIVLARDPSNADAYARAQQGANANDPSFTIQDSNIGAGAGGSLLSVLGAASIAGVAQNAGNALGAGDNGNANALLQLLSAKVGVPPVQTTSAAAAAAGAPASLALPVGSPNVTVGSVLALDAQPGGAGPQENVTVTSATFDPVTGIETIGFTPVNAHAAGYAVSSAPAQTLGQFYGNFVTQVGFDTQTATTGNGTQTALASSIDAQRQSISGINLDEQTQDLIQYQNAYAAAARTINVLDSLVSTVINSLGVGQ
jgi:flagellar hook-associated protein 1 FlgK